MKRILVSTFAALLLAACTGETETARPDPEPAPSETTPTPTPVVTEVTDEDDPGRTVPLQVWFLSQLRGEPVLRLHHAHVPATQAVGRAALMELLAGVPDDLEALDPRATSAVPEETRLLGLTIENGTAAVDFNDEFGDTGLGTTYDGIQIDQVVYTLTQFPTVKRVDFLINGERPEYIGGHGIVLDGPQTRKGHQHWLPPIVVENPYPGQHVEPPIRITGIANVFEATVSYRLETLGGGLLHKGFTTATCGTGCYGTFSESLPLHVKATTEVVLEVFESSAEDGSPLHKVRIPFTLHP